MPAEKVLTPKGDFISEEEAALYDRQIRLWGLDAQNRLRSSKMLLVGMTPIAAEVAKNVVLAGISGLDVWDNNVVAAEDTAINFLMPVESVGKQVGLHHFPLKNGDYFLKRSEACLQRIQALNSMVHVRSIAADSIEELINTLPNYDTVIVSCPLSLEGLSQWCRFADAIGALEAAEVTKPRLVCAATVGNFGAAFVDLHFHEYLE